MSLKDMGDAIINVLKGGQGSGNWGHDGQEGSWGGSSETGGTSEAFLKHPGELRHSFNPDTGEYDEERHNDFVSSLDEAHAKEYEEKIEEYKEAGLHEQEGETGYTELIAEGEREVIEEGILSKRDREIRREFSLRISESAIDEHESFFGDQPDVTEVDDPELYYDAVSLAKERNEYGQFVDAGSVESLSEKRMFLYAGGEAGFAVGEDGNITNVFKNPDFTKRKGTVYEMLSQAVDKGGDRLDNYDGALTTFYAQSGFQPEARLEFNREFAPDDWNYERDGEPDIMFSRHVESELSGEEMRDRILSGVYEENITTEGLPYADDYMEGKEMQEAGNKMEEIREKIKDNSTNKNNSINKFIDVLKGGQGSGNWGHEGQEGAWGGSSETGGTSTAFLEVSPEVRHSFDPDTGDYNEERHLQHCKDLEPEEYSEYIQQLEQEMKDNPDTELEDMSPLHDKYSVEELQEKTAEMRDVFSKQHNKIGIEKSFKARHLVDKYNLMEKDGFCTLVYAYHKSDVLKDVQRKSGVDDFGDVKREMREVDDYVEAKEVLRSGLEEKGLSAEEINEAENLFDEQLDMWSEVAGERVLEQWAETSGDNQPYSVSTQLAVQEEFGLKDAKTDHYPDGVVEIAEDINKIVGEGKKQFLRSQYEETQEVLREAGLDSIVAYRGMTFKDSSKLPDELSHVDFPYEAERTTLDFQSQPLSSFATEVEDAKMFTTVYDDYNMIIASEIPAENILSLHSHGFGCHYESEITVLGDTYKGDALVRNSTMKDLSEEELHSLVVHGDKSATKGIVKSIIDVLKGGQGSGNWGHQGASGMHGGSSAEYDGFSTTEECEQFLKENGHAKEVNFDPISVESANQITKAIVENPHLDEPLEGVIPYDSVRASDASVESDGKIRYNPQTMHNADEYAERKIGHNESDRFDYPDEDDIRESEQRVDQLEKDIYNDISEDRLDEAKEVLQDIEEADGIFDAFDHCQKMTRLLGGNPDEDGIDERVEDFMNENSNLEQLKEKYETGGFEKYSVYETIEETITHEIGHELTHRHAEELWMELEEDGEVVGMEEVTPEKAGETEVGREYNMSEWDNEEHQEIKNKLGEYSAVDLHEYIAESYTAVMHDKGEVHEDVRRFIVEQFSGKGGN